MQNFNRLNAEHTRFTAVHSRRTVSSLAAKCACGAGLSLVAITLLASNVVADQTEIVLTAATAEIGASPGVAFVQGEEVSTTADHSSGTMTQQTDRDLDAPLELNPLDADIDDWLDIVRGTRGRGP